MLVLLGNNAIHHVTARLHNTEGIRGTSSVCASYSVRRSTRGGEGAMRGEGMGQCEGRGDGSISLRGRQADCAWESYDVYSEVLK